MEAGALDSAGIVVDVMIDEGIDETCELEGVAILENAGVLDSETRVEGDGVGPYLLRIVFILSA